MSEYIYPVSVHTATDQDGTWQGHKDRKPPSVNPGMDFACAYGSPVVAAKAGTVRVADSNPDGSGGRLVYINHGDGTETQYLHLSKVQVTVGQRVAQGQQIALSGASGFGSDHGYAPHCHVSLWINGRNVDFMRYVGSASVASVTARPLSTETTIRRITKMDTIKRIPKADQDKGIWLVGPRGKYHLNPDQVALLDRWDNIDKYNPDDAWLTVQMDEMIGILNSIA